MTFRAGGTSSDERFAEVSHMFCGRLTEDAQEIHIKFAKDPQGVHRRLTELSQISQRSHRGLELRELSWRTH